ncbi:MAG: Rho termination factor N-terminal domain-containing protein [Myxococcota bacterium]
MAHSYEELKRKTVAELRALAKELGDQNVLHGYTTMHKEQLVRALCTALGVEAHEHHVVVGIDKGAVRAQIRELRAERDAALAARDRVAAARARRKIHRLKHALRRATV